MKKIIFIGIVIINLIGCGGSSSDGNNIKNLKTYDLWNYIGTNSSLDLNVSWDKYTLDDNNNTIETVLNYTQLTRFLNNKKVSEEIGSDNRNFVYWYEIDNNNNQYISRGLVNSAYGLLNRYADINDSINFWYNYNCKLIEHKNSYTPYSNYVYNDVLIFKCNNLIRAYQKNVGQIFANTPNEANKHFLYLLN